MTEIASPDKVLPNPDHDAAKAEDDAHPPHPGDYDALDESKDNDTAVIKGLSNGHVDASATSTTEPRTNGHHVNDSPDGEAHDDLSADERPSKRRRTRETTPPGGLRKPKPESPPWRKIAAEGPTSYTENGRRKSGRLNTVPVEFHPPGKKRMTRRAVNGAQGAPSKPQAVSNGTPRRLANGAQKPSSTTKTSYSKPAPNTTPKTASKKPALEPRSSTRSSRRRSPSPVTQPQPTRQSTRGRRSLRFEGNGDTEDAKQQDSRHAPHETTGRSPRIKLRVGRPGIIPLVHPDQVRKRPKIGTSFEDFWARAGDIPVEEGGLQASEDGPPYTEELARKDARMILRIEEEVEAGGLLSRGRCSVFLPEQEEEPPRQWARQDHMVKAMANFRKLMVVEQQRHRSTAKKIAEACREEWLRRQPKSADELEAEARAKWLAQYRLVSKAMLGTWENVRTEVNRRRLEEWEAEEQKRVKAALNEAVNISEQKLQARRAGLDSEIPSDEDDGFDNLTDDLSLTDEGGDTSDLGSDEEDEASSGDVDSDMMSSDEEEEEELKEGAADENLTQEQLQAKYANIPDLPVESEQLKAESAPTVEATDTVDTSDESVDMDDDMGSSDMDSDESGDGDDVDDDSEGSEDEDAGGSGGLLGLLFGKSELQKMNQEASKGNESAPDTEMPDVEMEDSAADQNLAPAEDKDADEDEVSLVRHPESVNGDPAENGIPSKPIQTPNSALDAEDNAAGSDGYAEGDISPSKPMGDKSSLQTESPRITMSNELQEKLSPAVTSTMSEKNISPGTDPATNSPSPQRSPSTATSETKPSEVDTSSAAKLALTKSQASNCASPQPSPRHKTDIPFLLRGTLREYQHDGLDWLAGLYANNTNGILAGK